MPPLQGDRRRVRRYLLTRSAYGSAWSPEANRRRLDLSRAVTVPSILGQTDRDFEWIVLLHPCDELLDERRAAFTGATFIYLPPEVEGTPSHVAWQGYRAGWAKAIGHRRRPVSMTRLDDDDALAPWAMERFGIAADKVTRRTALVLPHGLRVWQGRYTVVKHLSNAMQTLVTPAGDELTVYDYKHRDVRLVADVRLVDPHLGWVWSRHDDSISGWRSGERPLTPAFRALFPIDWSIFGSPVRQERVANAGRNFR